MKILKKFFRQKKQSLILQTTPDEGLGNVRERVEQFR